MSIEVNKTDRIVNVTVDKKYGKSIEFDIQGNTIGLKKEGDLNFTYTPDLKGEKGDIAIQGEYISYATLADAQAVNPKPSNGTLFQVEEEANRGVYTFQSGEAGGTRLETSLITEKVSSPSNVDPGFYLNLYGEVKPSGVAGRGVNTYTKEDNKEYTYVGYNSGGTASLVCFYDINGDFISYAGVASSENVRLSFIPPKNCTTFKTSYIDTSSSFKVYEKKSYNKRVETLETAVLTNKPTPLSIVSNFYIDINGVVQSTAVAGRYVAEYTIGKNKRYRYAGHTYSTNSLIIAYYDEDGNFISAPKTTSDSFQVFEFSPPIGAKTFKASYSDQNIFYIYEYEQHLDAPANGYNYNLLDYVKGQEMIAEKYSLPVCDLYRESGINFENKSIYVADDNLHYSAAGYAFIAQQTTDFIRKYGGFTDLTGKTIGVFGGSFSVIADSSNCKDVWVSELGVTYTNYGVSGAGFSDISAGGTTIEQQVDGATSKDIYILWCSTNDATVKAEIGTRDSLNPSSQSYGMNQCIKKLYLKNPNAKILIFTSAKTTAYDYLYNPSIKR